MRKLPVSILNFYTGIGCKLSITRIYTRSTTAWLIVLFLYAISFSSCTSRANKNSKHIIKVLESENNGINFSNDLSYDQDFNLMQYIYFNNVSGVANYRSIKTDKKEAYQKKDAYIIARNNSSTMVISGL